MSSALATSREYLTRDAFGELIDRGGAHLQHRRAQDELFDLAFYPVLIERLPGRLLIELQTRRCKLILIGGLHFDLTIEQVSQNVVVKKHIAGGGERARSK